MVLQIHYNIVIDNNCLYGHKTDQCHFQSHNSVSVESTCFTLYNKHVENIHTHIYIQTSSLAKKLQGDMESFLL